MEEGECGNLPWVDVHSALYEVYIVAWCCMDLWSIGGGEWGQSALCICAFCSI